MTKITKSLLGVIPHNTPKLTENGLIYKTKCLLCDKLIKSRSLSKHLLSHNMSVVEYIMMINGLKESDLSTCEFCNTNKCRIGSVNNRINLLKPVISPYCKSKSCGIKYNHYSQNLTLINSGKMINKVNKWKSTINGRSIQAKTNSEGYHKSEELTKSVLDELAILHLSGKNQKNITLHQVGLLNSNNGARGRFAMIDFYIPKFNIAIECDGSSHKSTADRDEYRDKILLDKLGIRTYRIKGGMLFDKDKLKSHLSMILKSCELLETP